VERYSGKVWESAGCSWTEVENFSKERKTRSTKKAGERKARELCGVSAEGCALAKTGSLDSAPRKKGAKEVEPLKLEETHYTKVVE